MKHCLVFDILLEVPKALNIQMPCSILIKTEFTSLSIFLPSQVFHCVHFECPANQKEPSICGSDRTDSSENSVISDTTISSIM